VPRALLIAHIAYQNERLGFPVMTDPRPRAKPLHRRFADLARVPRGRKRLSIPGQADRIARFADDFGWLGDPDIRETLTPVEPARLNEYVVGEHYLGWCDHISKLAALVQLWDLKNMADRRQLQQYFYHVSSPLRVLVYLAIDRGRLTTNPNPSRAGGRPRSLTYAATRCSRRSPARKHPRADTCFTRTPT
jgi:hypothetical protein